MTVGNLLVACVFVPLVAGAAAQLAGSLPRWLSLIAGLLAFAAALAITGASFFRPDHPVAVKLAVGDWAPQVDHVSPSLTLALPAGWGVAPSLLAASALLLLASAPGARHWFIHITHGAAQGALASTKPELGLAFVSMATGAACIDLVAGDATGSPRRMTIAVRWTLADLVLWTWVLGGLGVGQVSTWIVVVALAVRTGVFPFQGALVAASRWSPFPGSLLTPIAPAIWAYHWLDRGMFGNEESLGWLIAAATLLPALLTTIWTEEAARRAYGLASVLVWPAAAIPAMGAGWSLAGLGAAAVVATPIRSWGRIAASLAVLAPTLTIAASASAPVSASNLVAWSAVSLAAALLAANGLRKDSTTPDSLNSAIETSMEAALVILSLIPLATLLLSWTGRS